MPVIKFHSSRLYNNDIKDLAPSTAKKNLPDWWKNASLFWKNKDGSYLNVNYDLEKKEYERGLGFKSCPALLDIFTSGYVLKTPTDIMFMQHQGEPYVILDEEFKHFCSQREEMPEFKNPPGYHSKHFHWWPNWGVELPKGYSLLVTNPLNRFDLPFLTTSGIIDSDNYTSSGLMPFFLKEGFSGLVPKGTPFVQLIPIKREDWSSEYLYHSEDEINKRFEDTANQYRKPYGGIYKKETWTRKNYE